MMKSILKFRILFALALLIQLVAAPLYSLADELDTTAPSWVAPIDYLALGDSLASGVNTQGELGNGYVDFLAESLATSKSLKSYNKGFSYPGYEAINIVKDLQTVNLTKPVVGTGNEGQTAELQQSIADADLITISAGANDVLKFISIDKTTGKATIDTVGLFGAINKVGQDYKTILTEIYATNPNAQVYIMGYYNPFPSLSAELQPQLTQLLSTLNKAIQTGMLGTTAIFVPTADQIAENYAEYLPNPSNIHLSEAGYKVVTAQFEKRLKEHFQWIPAGTLTAKAKSATSVDLNWKPATDNEAVAGYVIYNGSERVVSVGANVTNFTVDHLDANKSYTFTVSAVDAAENESTINPSVQITTGTVPPLFSDIGTSYFKDYIEQAVALGLIKGHTDGTFKPEGNLTRAQAAAIIVRALELKTDEKAPFSDIASYAEETQAEIAAAYKYKIVKGSEGKFNPSAPVTRAQLALMMKRTYEMVTQKPYVATEVAPFSDIASMDPETKTAITMMYDLKIASGSNGKYMPSNSTNRGQASKMFVNFASVAK